jgi:uncharacterized membrane protein YqaE (UPF0057 family)
MGKLKLFLAAVVLSVGLFSCSSSDEFARVKYLDKTYAKKSKMNHKPERFNNGYQVNPQVEALENEANIIEASANIATEEVANQPQAVPATAPKTLTPKAAKVQAEKVEAIAAMPAAPKSLDEVYANVPVVKPKAKKKGLSGILGLNVIGTLVLIIIAILIPPLAVFLKTGADGRFWLNLLLSILFYGAIFFAPFLAFLPIIPIGHAILVVLEVL